MTANSPPYALQAGSHSAQLFRQAISTLLAPTGGVIGASDYLVTQNGVANMSVNVAGGAPGSGGGIWVPGTTSAGIQGLYYGYNDATVNLAIAASNPTNPRIDVPIAQVQDAAYAGAISSFQLAVVTGTPAASPVAPSLPASSYGLANVAVAALATTVVSANITDRRSQAAVGMSTNVSVLGSGGFSVIPTAESRSAVGYGTLTTPDQVPNVVVRAGDILCLTFEAQWQESVSGAGRAAIFIGANQLKSRSQSQGALPVTNAAMSANGSSLASIYQMLFSSPIGLLSGAHWTGDAGDQDSVSTGQTLGNAYELPTDAHDRVWAEMGGAAKSFQNISSGAYGSYIGSTLCLINVAAGTYTISVQYKASSGSVTAKNRRLNAWTRRFS